MKHLFTRPLLLVCALFLSASLVAQTTNVTIKTTDKDGNTVTNKYRVTDENSVDALLEDLDMESLKEIEVNVESDEGANFKFRTNNAEHIQSMQKNADSFGHLMERKHQQWAQGREVQVEKRALLGIYPKDAANFGGVVITGTVKNSGAEAAGLQAQDVITAIQGQTINNNSDLRRVLAQFEPNDQVTVNFTRNGLAQQVQATLGETQERVFVHKTERDPCKVFIGVSIGSTRGSEGGVRVSGIIHDTPAEKYQVQSGDVILAMDGVPVNTFNELLTERNKHEAGDAFVLTVFRNGEIQDIDAQFNTCDEEETSLKEPVEEAIVLLEDLQEDLPELELPTLQLEAYTAFPNPTYGALNVAFEAPAVPTTVVITDMSGKIVYQENLNQFDGQYAKELDLRNITPGVLFLTVQQSDKRWTEKIVLLARA